MIPRRAGRWFSPILEREVGVVRWGSGGAPVLLFPTAGGDAEECERFHMVEALAPLLASGRIRLYSCDSVAGKAWLSGEVDAREGCRMLNRFDRFVHEELAPAILSEGAEARDITAAGASLGAFFALAAVCRHPDTFGRAICLSGKYDLEEWLEGEMNLDFYYSSPVHFLPHLEDEEHLERLRRRFVLLATGHGKWENPQYAWHIASVLGSKGVPNRVDPWGPEWDHDWPAWRAMLPVYLGELGVAQESASE
ncbi:MAG: alpha/beta hydrolase-fold protein [Thermoanaerobaculia bacterium]